MLLLSPQIPDMVKAHYELRPSLLPKANETPDITMAPSRTTGDGPTPQEQEEVNNYLTYTAPFHFHVLKTFQLNFLRYLVLI